MTVFWSEQARHDVVRIFHFNSSYSEDRAMFIDGRLIGAGDLIARNPLLGRPIGRSGIRERSLTDIQYAVRYRMSSDDEITILRVRSTRENRKTP